MSHKSTNTHTKKENLRQRAYLNTITSWIDTGAKILVRFFINPIIISQLGASLFGVWQIIGQMSSYMATVDLRTGTSVKWIIARNRTTSDDVELKKTMSAAVYANLIFLPLYLIAGAILVWLAPTITNVEPEYYILVRLATGLLVLSFIINQFAFLLQSVLVGMNLSFKKIGVRAALTIIGGVATVAVLHFSYSLPAMAIVEISIAIVSGLILWWILKKHVEWFGFAKASWKRIIRLFQLTGKFMLLKTATILNESVDLVLLGYFAGPKHVAAYTITRYLVRTALMIMKNVSSAVTPGLGRLVGEGNYAKLFEARKIMITLNWFFLTVIGVVILLWNKSFVSIWTSQDLYVGQAETLLIVLIASLRIIQLIDGSIITMTLDIRNKIIATLISAAVTISLGAILIPSYQTFGLLIGLFSGMLTTTFAYSIIAQKKINGKRFLNSLLLSRPALVSIFLILTAGYLGDIFIVTNWISLIGVLGFTTILIAAFLILVMKKRDRNLIIANLKKIKAFKRKNH